MKGNAFTVEALLGALLFTVLLSAISAYANTSNDDGWTVPDEKIADDLLVVLEKKGTLSTLNDTLIENEINRILGNRFSFNLRLKTYGNTFGAMELLKTTNIGEDIPGETEAAVSEAGFFSTADGSVANYTIARLSIWR